MPISFGSLRDFEFPPEKAIIGDGVLRKGSKLIVGAAPKSYKSFMVNTVLAECLIGGNMFGVHAIHRDKREEMFKIAPVEKVLLIEQELGLEDNLTRLLPLYQSLTREQQAKFDAGLYIHSCDFTVRLDQAQGILNMAKLINEVRPQVVCVDPFIKFHRSNENDPSEMNQVLCALSELAARYEFATIVIHHTSKMDGNSTRQGLDLLRGGSSIAGDLDTGMLLTVRNRAAGIVKVSTDLKRGKPIRDYLIKLNPVSLRMEFLEWAKSA